MGQPLNMNFDIRRIFKFCAKTANDKQMNLIKRDAYVASHSDNFITQFWYFVFQFGD